MVEADERRSWAKRLAEKLGIILGFIVVLELSLSENL
jgi:hypothetical protein